MNVVRRPYWRDKITWGGPMRRLISTAPRRFLQVVLRAEMPNEFGSTLRLSLVRRPTIGRGAQEVLTASRQSCSTIETGKRCPALHRRRRISRPDGQSSLSGTSSVPITPPLGSERKPFRSGLNCPK